MIDWEAEAAQAAIETGAPMQQRHDRVGLLQPDVHHAQVTWPDLPLCRPVRDVAQPQRHRLHARWTRLQMLLVRGLRRVLCADIYQPPQRAIDHLPLFPQRSHVQGPHVRQQEGGVPTLHDVQLPGLCVHPSKVSRHQHNRPTPFTCLAR